MKKKTKHEKGVSASFTMARVRVEVRIALYTAQPPFLVSGFLRWFLLLFRSSAILSVCITAYKQPPPSLHRQHYRVV